MIYVSSSRCIGALPEAYLVSSMARLLKSRGLERQGQDALRAIDDGNRHCVFKLLYTLAQEFCTYDVDQPCRLPRLGHAVMAQLSAL